MEDLTFKRARSPEAKAARRNDLLQAAAFILEDQGYEHLTLQAIAQHAQVSKSNIYRYFESREEILVRLLIADISEALSGAPIAGHAPLAEVAQGFAAMLSTNPRLGLLISQLAPILERNITGDTLLDIKKSLMMQAEQAALGLQAQLEGSTAAQCSQIVRLVYTHLAGLWPMAHPGPEVKAAQSALGGGGPSPDFSESLAAATLVIMRGVLL